MLDPNRVQEIFADAHAMHGAALERLAVGDIRDAAEKAWCATVRSTDALILARTGREPLKTPQTSEGLDRLSDQEPAARTLLRRYYSRQLYLHGNCFYLGIIENRSELERRIRETIDYISDAERLASA